MKPVKKILPTDRAGYLAAAALFVFFLLFSAPHQVHHAFDQDHSAPCQAFSSAKSCHLQPVATVELSVSWIAGEWLIRAVEVLGPQPSGSPFTQRAPPLV